MGHKWDQPEPSGDRQLAEGASANRRFQAWCESWAREALRVLKPGGYLLCFGGTRTAHRLGVGLEDAGLEIRDTLCWLYGSGFPKSRDPLHGMESLPRATGRGAWREWHRLARVMGGTALKPCHEQIILARAPLTGPLAQNLLEHRTGALNIDGCRVDVADRLAYARNHAGDRAHTGPRLCGGSEVTAFRMGGGSAADGRWPGNVVLDELVGGMLDEREGDHRGGGYLFGNEPSNTTRHVYGGWTRRAWPGYGDRGGASRFFYCAKTTRTERDAGLEGFEAKPSGDRSPGTFQSDGTDKTACNHHPTVKPIALMRWLVRLVCPPGGTVLDPTTGSGSTGCAAVLEGLRFIGFERRRDYAEIARARIGYWRDQPQGPTRPSSGRPPEDQATLFDLLAGNEDDR